MKRLIRKIPADRVREQAAQWMVRLHADDFGELQREVFINWLNEDPQHKIEFENLAPYWDGIGQIDDPVRREHIVFATKQFAGPRWKISMPVHFVAAACGAVSAVLMLVVFSFLGLSLDATKNSEHASLAGEYTTAAGDNHSILLDDGSVLHLNVGTSVRWSLNDDARQIDLVYGEVLFDVARDSDRPFIVNAGAGGIEALGTRFNVYRKRNDNVVVSVLEGSVRVHRAEGKSDIPIWERQLIANQEIGYQGTGLTFDVRNIDAEQVVSWRDGVIFLDSRTLIEIVEELSRYSTRRIVILDPRLNEMRFGGVVSVMDIPETLQFLADTAPLRIVETSDAYLITGVGAGIDRQRP